MDKSNEAGLIQRYSASQRINHWILALSFILLAASGLALFHPSMYWLSNLLGGGTWTRILHPFIGVFMFVCFIVFAVRMVRHNMIARHDVAWLKRFRDVLGKREDRVPEAGRYNAGQKLVYWVFVLCMAGLLLTGLVMWRSYFSYLFPIGLIRFASLLHAFFGFVMICAIIVHVYAGIWVKGSIRAMTRGTVTPGWAWKHHRGWLRQLKGTSSHKHASTR